MDEKRKTFPRYYQQITHRSLYHRFRERIHGGIRRSTGTMRIFHESSKVNVITQNKIS